MLLLVEKIRIDCVSTTDLRLRNFIAGIRPWDLVTAPSKSPEIKVNTIHSKSRNVTMAPKKGHGAFEARE